MLGSGFPLLFCIASGFPLLFCIRLRSSTQADAVAPFSPFSRALLLPMSEVGGFVSERFETVGGSDDRAAKDSATCSEPKICGICNFDDSENLVEGNMVHLACAYVFHHECIEGFKEVRSFSDAEVPCPLCKLSAIDAASMTEKLLNNQPEQVVVPSAPSAQQVAATDEVHSKLPPPAMPTAAPSPAMKCMPVSRELEEAARRETDLVLCNLCGGMVELENSILRGKQTGTFRCKVCHSKAEIIRKKCGGYPPPVFAQLSEEQKHDFFSKTVSSKDSLQREINNVVRRIRREEKTWALGGEYRPLKFWENQGYCPDRIIANSEADDIRECRVAGTVYRVPVMSHGNCGSEGTETIDEQRASAPSQRLKLKAGKWAASGDDDDADSSSATSSACGDPKKIITKAKRKAQRASAKAKKKAQREINQAKTQAKAAQDKAKHDEKKAAKQLKKEETKLQTQLKSDVKQSQKDSKETAKRKNVANEGKVLLNKAIKTAIVSTVKADALGVDEAAYLSLKNKLGDMKDALQACE